MKTKTQFEEVLKEISDISHVSEKEILHKQTQMAAMMYRFLTKDLEALDIVTYKDGEIKIFKNDKQVKLSNRVSELILWAVIKVVENKVLAKHKKLTRIKKIPMKSLIRMDYGAFGYTEGYSQAQKGDSFSNAKMYKDKWREEAYQKGLKMGWKDASDGKPCAVMIYNPK